MMGVSHGQRLHELVVVSGPRVLTPVDALTARASFTAYLFCLLKLLELRQACPRHGTDDLPA
jgi:hypothetical protein